MYAYIGECLPSNSLSCVCLIVCNRCSTLECITVVSYWAVLLGSVLDEGSEMLSRIRKACPCVQLKQITSLTRIKHSAPTDSNPLYVVLKDHNSVFVNQKIVRSLQPSQFHTLRANAKLLVMSDCVYLPQIPVCVQALQDAGLYMEAEVMQSAPSSDSQA